MTISINKIPIPFIRYSGVVTTSIRLPKTLKGNAPAKNQRMGCQWSSLRPKQTREALPNSWAIVSTGIAALIPIK